MSYDTNAPKPGDEILLDGLKFTVTKFIPGEWPRPNRIEGFSIDLPDHTDSLVANEYRDAYHFAEKNYNDIGLDAWLAKMHGDKPELQLGKRYAPTRPRKGRPVRYTIVGYAGLRYLIVEVKQHDGTLTRQIMSRQQWLRFY